MATANTYASGYVPPSDPSERDRLIVENLPLVRWMANRLHGNLPASIPLEDLVSTGVLGLIAAVDNFDPRYNVKLSTYALPRIRGAILDSVRGLDGISGPKRRRLKAVQTAISGLEQSLQRTPSEEEISAELGLPLEEYQQWMHDLQGVKLKTITPPEEGGSGLLSILSDNEEHEPGFQLERSELERVLAEGIANLPKREKLVLSLYYKEELTLREIGTVMKVHLTRVSQLKTQGLVRLRAYMERYWPTTRGAIS